MSEVSMVDFSSPSTEIEQRSGSPVSERPMRNSATRCSPGAASTVRSLVHGVGGGRLLGVAVSSTEHQRDHGRDHEQRDDRTAAERERPVPARHGRVLRGLLRAWGADRRGYGPRVTVCTLGPGVPRPGDAPVTSPLAHGSSPAQLGTLASSRLRYGADHADRVCGVRRAPARTESGTFPDLLFVPMPHRGVPRAPRQPGPPRGDDLGRRWARCDGFTPIDDEGRRLSCTDPSGWTTYKAVTSARARKSGVGDGYGVMLGSGLGCHMLARCVDGDTLSPWAKEVVAGIAEPILHAERSVTGTGLHVYVEAMEGPARRREGVGAYSRNRFVRVTGDTVFL